MCGSENPASPMNSNSVFPCYWVSSLGVYLETLLGVYPARFRRDTWSSENFLAQIYTP